MKMPRMPAVHDADIPQREWEAPVPPASRRPAGRQCGGRATDSSSASLRPLDIFAGHHAPRRCRCNQQCRKPARGEEQAEKALSSA